MFLFFPAVHVWFFLGRDPVLFAAMDGGIWGGTGGCSPRRPIGRNAGGRTLRWVVILTDYVVSFDKLFRRMVRTLVSNGITLVRYSLTGSHSFATLSNRITTVCFNSQIHKSGGDVRAARMAATEPFRTDKRECGARQRRSDTEREPDRLMAQRSAAQHGAEPRSHCGRRLSETKRTWHKGLLFVRSLLAARRGTASTPQRGGTPPRGGEHRQPERGRDAERRRTAKNNATTAAADAVTVDADAAAFAARYQDHVRPLLANGITFVRCSLRSSRL